MDANKTQLKRRYLKAVRRVAREDDLIGRARDRKLYWQKVTQDLEKRLELNASGQLEFKDIPTTTKERL